jgi:hypothetical protein
LSLERSGNSIKVEAWWEELRHEEANDQRFLFLHLVDSSGKILHNQQIALHPYQPPHETRRWRYAAVTFDEVSPDAASLAVGVYQRRGAFLMADKGRPTGMAGWGSAMKKSDIFAKEHERYITRATGCASSPPGVLSRYYRRLAEVYRHVVGECEHA